MKELVKNQNYIDNTYFKGVREKTDLAYWAMAIGGESGELQNAIKKLVRGHIKDGSEEEIKLKIAEECADVLIYLIILSQVLDFDLKQITLEKQKINIIRMKTNQHKCMEAKYDEEKTRNQT
jgi:NTP pyrophosphatase (non-canonical NTP hydrolase)